MNTDDFINTHKFMIEKVIIQVRKTTSQTDISLETASQKRLQILYYPLFYISESCIRESSLIRHPDDCVILFELFFVVF